jgi:nicotinamidase-related amidase
VFTSTKPGFILNNMGIEQLLVTGVVTNVCVEGAARSADDLGFDVFLIDDACAALSPTMHAHSLRSFGPLIRIRHDNRRSVGNLAGEDFSVVRCLSHG